MNRNLDGLTFKIDLCDILYGTESDSPVASALYHVTRSFARCEIFGEGKAEVAYNDDSEMYTVEPQDKAHDLELRHFSAFIDGIDDADLDDDEWEDYLIERYKDLIDEYVDFEFTLKEKLV